MNNKIGIFWGSFDPPHMGHIFAAVHASLTMDLHKIWILPVFNHPFGKQLTSFQHRLYMCDNAFRGIPKCYVKDFDENNNPGHCIDLLKLLNEKYGDHYDWVMLGGTDVNSNNSKHKDVEEIMKLCTIARVPRASYSTDKYAIPNYSSSEIKQLIKEGKSIEGLVPLDVESYITENKLYGA